MLKTLIIKVESKGERGREKMEEGITNAARVLNTGAAEKSLVSTAKYWCAKSTE